MRARRHIGAALLAAMVASLTFTGSALGRVDDKPLAIFAPADGAVIADATQGVAVEFTCAVYHPTVYDDWITQPTDGYHVVLSSSPAVDPVSGLLLPAGRVELRTATMLDGTIDHCTATPDDAGLGLLPREPGTYWWQAYRDCAPDLCKGAVEVSDVSSFTVRTTVCSATRGALRQARMALRQARAALHRRHTAGRRARVARLSDRVDELHRRLRDVYGCRVA